MIVKFARRGKGGGSGPVDYLLGKDRERDGSRVLRGDPEAVREIIDSVQFKQRYKSGFLSFEEENITESDKQKIMDSFQEALLPGLDPSQFAILWVEHLDKGRLELNFVIPTIELQTAKRLQPYYDPIDRQRVDDWKNLTNHKFGLTDPNDPMKKRKLNIRGIPPLDVKHTKELITKIVGELIEAKEITDRTTLLTELKIGGFKIAKVADKYISIENPHGARNIRLDGSYFEFDLRSGDEMAKELAKKTAEYRAGTGERISKIHKRYTSASEHRAEKNREQYRRREPESSPAVTRPTPQALANAIAQPDSDISNDNTIGANHSSLGLPEFIRSRQGGADGGWQGVDSLHSDSKRREKHRILHDKRELEDVERARANVIRDCEVIGSGARERTEANESADDRDQTVARIHAASTQIDRIIAAVSDNADRAIRAVNEIVEQLKIRFEATRKSDPEPDRGPRM